jgi:hypothetical protein
MFNGIGGTALLEPQIAGVPTPFQQPFGQVGYGHGGYGQGGYGVGQDPLTQQALIGSILGSALPWINQQRTGVPWGTIGQVGDPTRQHQVPFQTVFGQVPFPVGFGQHQVPFQTMLGQVPFQGIQGQQGGYGIGGYGVGHDGLVQQALIGEVLANTLPWINQQRIGWGQVGPIGQGIGELVRRLLPLQAGFGQMPFQLGQVQHPFQLGLGQMPYLPGLIQPGGYGQGGYGVGPDVLTQLAVAPWLTAAALARRWPVGIGADPRLMLGV